MLNSIINEKKEVYEDLKEKNVYIAHDIRNFQGRDPEDYYSIFVGTPKERKENKFKIYGHVEEKVITPSNLGEYCGDSKFFSDSQELKKLEAIEKENEDKEKDFNEGKESYMDLVNSLYWDECYGNEPRYYYDDYERYEVDRYSYFENTFEDIENFLDGKGDIDIDKLDNLLDSTIKNITRELSLDRPAYFDFDDEKINSFDAYSYFENILKLAEGIKSKLNFFRNIKKGIYNKKDVDLDEIEELRRCLEHDSYTPVSPEYCRELILLHKANIEDANKELQDVMKQVRFIRGIYLLLVSGIDLSKINLDLFTEGISLLEDVPEYEKALKKETE